MVGTRVHQQCYSCWAGSCFPKFREVTMVSFLFLLQALNSWGSWKKRHLPFLPCNIKTKSFLPIQVCSGETWKSSDVMKIIWVTVILLPRNIQKTIQTNWHTRICIRHPRMCPPVHDEFENSSRIFFTINLLLSQEVKQIIW